MAMASLRAATITPMVLDLKAQPDFENQRVLVTGGSGFLGQAVQAALARRKVLRRGRPHQCRGRLFEPR